MAHIPQVTAAGLTGPGAHQRMPRASAASDLWKLWAPSKGRRSTGGWFQCCPGGKFPTMKHQKNRGELYWIVGFTTLSSFVLRLSWFWGPIFTWPPNSSQLIGMVGAVKAQAIFTSHHTLPSCQGSHFLHIFEWPKSYSYIYIYRLFFRVIHILLFFQWPRSFYFQIYSSDGNPPCHLIYLIFQI